METQFKFEGSKYRETKELTLKEIAKLVRADLKKYKTKIESQSKYKVNFGVVCEHYSMGQTLHITIKPINFTCYNKNFKQDERISDNNQYHTNEYLKLSEALDFIANQYNYDDSDSQIDYFSTRFYVQIHVEEENRNI